jgi:NifU-like protein
VASWRGGDLESDRELDPLLCRCLGIPEEAVRQAIAVRSLTSVDAVVEATGAGSVCGTCRTDIPSLLDAAVAKPEAAAAASPASRIQLLHRIARAAEGRLLPELRARGGDLELWDLAGTRVLVRARGSLVEDDHAKREALAALEALLKSEVDPSLQVGE